MKITLYNKILLSVILLLLILVYWEIYLDMARQWNEDPNYSHGFLVPVISGYFFWQNWEELKKMILQPTVLGLLLIFFGLFLLVVGMASQEYYTKRSSLIFVLAGITAFLYGWPHLKKTLFPLGFLFFMVPLPYIIYDSIAFPLKLFVAKFSVMTLKAMNVVVLREGNVIMFPNTVLEVADACSGLRSIMSLLALSVTIAVFFHTSVPQRVFLVLMAVPIAVATNMVRVIGTGFLAQYYGAAAADGFFHEFAGMGIFFLAMVLLLLTSTFLRKVFK